MKCPDCGNDNSSAPIICAECGSQFSAGAGAIGVPEFQIARFDLRPGDILVVKSPEVLSYDQVQFITRLLKEQCEGHRVMVLSEGMDLAVLTAAEIAERTA